MISLEISIKLTDQMTMTDAEKMRDELLAIYENADKPDPEVADIRIRIWTDQPDVRYRKNLRIK